MNPNHKKPAKKMVGLSELNAVSRMLVVVVRGGWQWLEVWLWQWVDRKGGRGTVAHVNPASQALDFG